MLTKKSSIWASGKKIIVVPLIVLFAILFTNYAYSGAGDNEKHVNGNVTNFRGNKFEKEVLSDTITVVDPVTGQEQMAVTKMERFAKMNGEKVYYQNDINTGANKLGEPANEHAGLTSNGLKEYLLANITNEFSKLADGDYYINLTDIIVDKNGKIAYFDFDGISTQSQFSPKKNKTENINKEVKKLIDEKLYRLILHAPAHSPASFNRKSVPYDIDNGAFSNYFTIKAHKLVFE